MLTRGCSVDDFTRLTVLLSCCLAFTMSVSKDVTNNKECSDPPRSKRRGKRTGAGWSAKKQWWRSTSLCGLLAGLSLPFSSEHATRIPKPCSCVVHFFQAAVPIYCWLVSCPSFLEAKPHFLLLINRPSIQQPLAPWKDQKVKSTLLAFESRRTSWESKTVHAREGH